MNLQQQAELKAAYLIMHKASGLKVGDTVRVIRRVKSHQMGWDVHWNSDMNRSVGKTFRITKDGGWTGFTLGEWFTYPWFCLELVEAGKKGQNHSVLAELAAWSKEKKARNEH